MKQPPPLTRRMNVSRSLLKEIVRPQIERNDQKNHCSNEVHPNEKHTNKKRVGLLILILERSVHVFQVIRTGLQGD